MEVFTSIPLRLPLQITTFWTRSSWVMQKGYSLTWFLVESSGIAIAKFLKLLAAD